jgi:hypothetical protein
MVFLVVILTFVVLLNKSVDHWIYDKPTRDVERQQRYMFFSAVQSGCRYCTVQCRKVHEKAAQE